MHNQVVPNALCHLVALLDILGAEAGKLLLFFLGFVEVELAAEHCGVVVGKRAESDFLGD